MKSIIDIEAWHKNDDKLRKILDRLLSKEGLKGDGGKEIRIPLNYAK